MELIIYSLVSIVLLFLLSVFAILMYIVIFILIPDIWNDVVIEKSIKEDEEEDPEF